MAKVGDFSIGVDIESIARFKNLHRQRSQLFLAKIFTEDELNYCFSKKPPSPHLAVRFAAKEAVVKAVGSLCKKLPALNEIEISHNAYGAPIATLRGYKIKISLSHCDDKAIAFAVVEKNNASRIQS